MLFNDMAMGYVLIKRIVRKIRYIFLKPYYYIYGRLTLKTLVNNKSENEIIIVLSGLIGDSLYGLSCIDALKEKKRNITISVIGNKKWERMIESFQNIDRITYYSTQSKEKKGIDSFLWSPYLVRKGIKNDIYNTNPYYYDNEGTINDLVGNIYGLVKDYPITYHSIRQEKVKVIDEFENKKNRIIVINPYSVSAPFFSNSLWERLSEEAANRGFYVYTNVIGDQKQIKGTEPLRCDIYELYSIACNIPLFVSQRSGVLDFLIPSEVNMFVLYENLTEKFYSAYTLKGWKPKGKVIEIHGNYNVNQIINRFILFVNEIMEDSK